jgi:hypothetical protein
MNPAMDHSNAGVCAIFNMCRPSQMANEPMIVNRTTRPVAMIPSILPRG